MKARTVLLAGLSGLLVLAPGAVAPIARAAPTVARSRPALPLLPKNASGYRELTVEQLAAGMKNKDFTLINVHVPYQGDLPHTDLSTAFNRIASHLDRLPGKNAPIVLYCRSGHMSAQAAATLAAAGYTRVYELQGGFNAWKAAGHALSLR